MEFEISDIRSRCQYQEYHYDNNKIFNAWNFTFHGLQDAKRMPTLQEIHPLCCNSIQQPLSKGIINFKNDDKMKNPFKMEGLFFQNERVIWKCDILPSYDKEL